MGTEEYRLHGECKVVHRNDDDDLPAELAPDIVTADYPEGDYHRFFYGEIMPVCAARNIEKHE